MMKPDAELHSATLVDLADVPRWVCWDAKKTPVNPKTGGNAQSNNPGTWATLQRARQPASRKSYESGKPRPPIMGVGIVLGAFPSLPGPALGGIDLDNCFDASLLPKPWAREVMNRFPGFWETSPSGRGLHTIFSYDPESLPPSGGKYERGTGDDRESIELYLTDRYFTVTFRLWTDLPGDIAELLGDPPLGRPSRTDITWLTQQAGPRFKGDQPSTDLGEESSQESDDDDWLGLASHNQRTDLSFEEFASAVRAIKNDEGFDGRDDWRNVVASIHHETAGSEEGFQLADEWSRSWTSGGYDHEKTRAAWDSFKDSPSRRNKTGSYIIMLAKRDGWTPPPRRRNDPLTAGGDVENGRAFAARYRDEFKNCHATGEWLRWTGVRWESCTRGEEVEAAKALAGDMLERATAEYRKAETDKAKARHKAALDLFKNRARLASMLDMAKTEPTVVVSPDSFDVDPMLLGVRNGVLDLERGTLVPPDPTQRISRQAGTEFDPEATCPRWLQFLADVQPDPGVRGFLQRAVGYTLTGLVDEEKWLFAHGVGANGKSVFANVLNALMGEYAITVSATLLAKNRNEGEAGRLVARLPGARLALANETRQGDVWDDQRMKELISRERISARKLYSEGFDFFPTHKLWVRGNHLPGVLDASDAFWRRMLPIAFSRQFAEDQRVPDLDRQIIAAELSGILNWAVEGCLMWRRNGLNVPPGVRQEAARYREETDVVGMWREDCCRPDPDVKIAVAAAYRSYSEFCRDQGMGALSQPAFTRLMTAKGIDRCKGTGGKRMFMGFSLIESDAGKFSDEASDII